MIIDRELTTPESAGIGYILFSVAMVIARLLGDGIVKAIGEFKVLIFGVIITILGNINYCFIKYNNNSIEWIYVYWFGCSQPCSNIF